MVTVNEVGGGGRGAEVRVTDVARARRGLLRRFWVCSWRVTHFARGDAVAGVQVFSFAPHFVSTATSHILREKRHCVFEYAGGSTGADN